MKNGKIKKQQLIAQNLMKLFEHFVVVQSDEKILLKMSKPSDDYFRNYREIKIYIRDIEIPFLAGFLQLYNLKIQFY